MKEELDGKDRALLALLLEDAHMSFKEIGARIGLSAGTVHFRLERLKRLGGALRELD